MRLRLFLLSALLVGIAAQPEIGSAQHQVNGRALGFSATSMNGKRLFVRDLVKDGPVFLYFIRPGDSVNDQFAGRLHQIINTYSPGEAKWYGVMVGDRGRADSWSAEHAPPYEMLLDQNLSLSQLYGVESSPAVVRVDTDGSILGEWAGYSGFRLKQINEAVAKANNQSFKYIDFNDTPSTTRYGTPLIRTRGAG